jgi:hypothetical protein
LSGHGDLSGEASSLTAPFRCDLAEPNGAFAKHRLHHLAVATACANAEAFEIAAIVVVPRATLISRVSKPFVGMPRHLNDVTPPWRRGGVQTSASGCPFGADGRHPNIAAFDSSQDRTVLANSA